MIEESKERGEVEEGKCMENNKETYETHEKPEFAIDGESKFP